jgi:hypothetical protein
MEMENKENEGDKKLKSWSSFSNLVLVAVEKFKQLLYKRNKFLHMKA